MPPERRFECRILIADLIFADSPEGAKREFIERWSIDELLTNSIEVTEIFTKPVTKKNLLTLAELRKAIKRLGG
jgi:hypothetical protein